MHRFERAVILTAAGVVIVAGTRAASAIVAPFLLAVFVAILATPGFLAMRRRGISTATSLLVLMLALAGAGFAVANIVSASVGEFTRHVPDYQKALVAQRESLAKWLEARGVDIERLQLEEQLDPRSLLRYAGTMAAALSGLVGQGFLILLIVVFLLLELAILPEKLQNLPGMGPDRWSRLEQTVLNVRRYSEIKTIMSLLTGLCIGLWAWVLGLDQVLLLAFLAFLLNYVPAIGSIVASLPAILIALTKFGPGTALACAAGYAAINIGISNFLEPRVMGKRLGLSPLVVIISIVFWGWMLGPVGMLLSAPLTMAFKIALQDDPDLGWIAVLLGASPSKESAPTRRVARK